MINYMPKLVERATYSKGRTAPATAEQIEAWQAWARAFNATRRLTEASLVGSQLDGSDYDVLLTLSEGPPEGLRPTELAERVLLTKSGMTRLVDRLADRGLIERRACATDRRGHLVTLTVKGRHLQRRAAPGLLRALGAAFATTSPTDVAALKRLSERILEGATAHSPE